MTTFIGKVQDTRVQALHAACTTPVLELAYGRINLSLLIIIITENVIRHMVSTG